LLPRAARFRRPGQTARLHCRPASYDGCSLQNRAGPPARPIACIGPAHNVSTTPQTAGPPIARWLASTVARCTRCNVDSKHDDMSLNALQYGGAAHVRQPHSTRRRKAVRCSLLGCSFTADQQPLAVTINQLLPCMYGLLKVQQRCAYPQQAPGHSCYQATCAPQSQTGGECHVEKQVGGNPLIEDGPRIHKRPASKGSQYIQMNVFHFIRELTQVRVPDSAVFFIADYSRLHELLH